VGGGCHAASGGTNLTAPSGHLQVLGQMGRGKTTTLSRLGERFRLQGRRADYEYLPVGRDAFTTPLAGLDVFLLDEMQRLRLDERQRPMAAASRGLSLVLGSHDDMTLLVERAGLPLRTVRLESGGRVHLGAILTRRLDYFALPIGQPGVILEPRAVTHLDDTFGGDLRSLERFLCQVFQKLDASGVFAGESLRTAAAAIGI
jgi:hypothetical protein